MRAQFIRGLEPKEAMGIGDARFKYKIEELQERYRNGEYTHDKDFEDDRFIMYLYKDIYKKWKIKKSKMISDVITIWGSETGGGTPIIKIKAPGIRQTTLLRGEAYYSCVSEDILNLLNSPEMKKKIVDQYHLQSINELSSMISSNAGDMGMFMAGWKVAEKIAKRLIKIYEKES